MRQLFLLAAALVLAGNIHADHHGGKAMVKKELATILAADFRAEDRDRDDFRHPAKTLAFFGIKPTMAVGEYGPGGGWYTRVIAPLVANSGRYVAVHADIERYHAGQPADRNAKRKAAIEAFPGKVTEWTGIASSKISSVEIDEAKDLAGSLDAVVIFRSLHGLTRKDMADETLGHFYTLLRPGGIVGVVQHRAQERAPWDYTRGHNGYLKQSEVVAMFEAEGFDLIKTSEVNANPKDTADWDGGVWSLPPTLRHGDTDKDKYLAVGESDRMTLVFRKPG